MRTPLPAIALSQEQRQILARWREILLEAEGHRLLAVYASAGSSPRPPDSEQELALLRLFAYGEEIESKPLGPFVPQDVMSALEDRGLIQRRGGAVTTGDYRLVYHAGLLLFCHKASADARFYYGSDSLTFSRALLPVEGTVLDLCSGVGTQALVCAQTATAVTAVEIEPLAENVFWVNAALNNLSERVEFLTGDLYGPVAGRRFDRICCNPPFLPVPPGIPFPLYAGGGPDGLTIVRMVLAGLPEFLALNGRCQIIGSILGTRQGPDVSSLEPVALEAGIRIEFTFFNYEELDESTIGSFAATCLDSSRLEEAREIYRAHFERLGATRLYYFVLNAVRNPLVHRPE